jgi:hypothetical protein
LRTVMPRPAANRDLVDHCVRRTTLSRIRFNNANPTDDAS